MDSPNLDHALRFKNNAVRAGYSKTSTSATSPSGRFAHAVLTVDFTTKRARRASSRPSCATLRENLKSGKSRYALDVQGFANAPVYALRLKTATFENVERPAIVRNVSGSLSTTSKSTASFVDKLV